MPSERVPMRKIRDVLRSGLGHGLPQRAVGRSLDLSQAAVNRYLGRARQTGVGWPLPEGLDDERLEALLFPPMPDVPAEQRPLPDWAWVHRELRRPNVTLALLWEGHRQLVELRLRWCVTGTACSWLRRSGDAGDLGPSLEGLAPGGSILGGGHLMAAKVEEVADPIVGGQEALRLAG